MSSLKQIIIDMLRGFSNVLITYNSDYVKDPPKPWKNLWDPKYKGKIFLLDTTTSQGISLLVIFICLNGGSEKNIDPGFAKLASIKPNVLTFWTRHDQVARMLNTGEV
jgi:putative spermidine/putrescine transport system substrate-binding protein